MAHSFNIKNYTILTSLNEQVIYIKITDSINFMCYEENIQQNDLRKDITLSDQYMIIQKCFSSVDGYSVSMSVNSGNLKIKFVAIVGGFLRIEFAVFIKEKILSNDGQLTVNFNRIEQKQDVALQSLVARCQMLERRLEEQNKDFETKHTKIFEILDQIEINTSPPAHWSDKTHIDNVSRISSKQISLIDNRAGGIIYRNLPVFYQLQKLTIRPFTSLPNLTTLENSTVSEIELDCAGNGTFISLDGINNFPNLQTLTVINSPNLTNVIVTLKTKIMSRRSTTATNGIANQVHQIKNLKFVTCPKVNVVEMQTYCLENKITIAFA
jgi:hypothetical protein